jgi:hypothetical protein
MVQEKIDLRPKVMEPGTYHVVVTSADVGVTQKGDPKINVRFQILDDARYTGKLLFRTFVPSVGDWAHNIFVWFVQACGRNVAKDYDTSYEDLAKWLKDKDLMVNVEHDVDQNGLTTETVRRFSKIK